MTCCNLLILVDAHQIKPILLLGTRLKKLDLPVPKGPEKPFISHITHTVKSEFGLSFLQQNRLHEDVVRLRSSTVVINQPGYLQQIQSS